MVLKAQRTQMLEVDPNLETSMTIHHVRKDASFLS